MPDSIYVDIFKPSRFDSSDEMSQCLDLLNASPDFSLTHWAKNERPSAKRKYSKDAILAHKEDGGDYNLVHLYREKNPVYHVWFSSGSRFKPSLLSLSFEDTKDLSPNTVKEIFKLGSTFARHLEAVFGYVYLAWDDDQGKYMRIKIVNSAELAECGPNPVHARTWFGPHLVKLIGRDQLFQSGAIVRDTDWGGIECDLFPEPWQATLDELVKRQREVMECLQQTEVFGDYSKKIDFYPGKRWVHWNS